MKAVGADECALLNPARTYLPIRWYDCHHYLWPDAILCGSGRIFRNLSSSLMNNSPFLRSPVTQWKRPVLKLSAPEIHTLRFVPGVLSGLCLPFRIQQNPTLGLVSSRVSSWKKEPAFSAISRMSLSLLRFCSLCSSESFSGGTGRGLLQRKPRRWSTRRSVSRLTRTARFSNSSTARSLQLQRERSYPWEVGDSSSTRHSIRSSAGPSINGLVPRRARSSKTPVVARSHPTKRFTSA